MHVYTHTHDIPTTPVIREAMLTTVAPMPLTAAESQLCLPEDAVLVFLADTAAAHIARCPACFSLEGGALTQGVPPNMVQAGQGALQSSIRQEQQQTTQRKPSVGEHQPVSSISIAEDTAFVEAVEWVRGLVGLFRVLNMNVASVLQEMRSANTRSTQTGYAKIVRDGGFGGRSSCAIIYRDAETAGIQDTSRIQFKYGDRSVRGARPGQAHPPLHDLAATHDVATGEWKVPEFGSLEERYRFHLFVDGVERFYWERGPNTPDHFFTTDDDEEGHVCAGIVEADTAIRMLKTAKSCIAAFEHSIGAGIHQAAAGRPAECRLKLQLWHDELAASLASFLGQSVTLHAWTSDSEAFLNFVRDELATLSEADEQPSRQRTEQVLYHTLLTVRTPGDALQFLGCRRGPRAWRDVARGTLPHAPRAWSVVETLFATSIRYASQRTTETRASGAFQLSHAAPLAAALVSSIFKLQAAVFISKSPAAYDSYVSVYLKGGLQLLTALEETGAGLSVAAHSYLPATLMPLLLHLGKIEWSTLQAPTRRALVQFAIRLQELVETECPRLQQGCDSDPALVSLVCPAGHTMTDLVVDASDSAIPALINNNGAPVKLVTTTPSSVPFAVTTEKYYCGQLFVFFSQVKKCEEGQGQCPACLDFQQKNASKLAKTKCAVCGQQKYRHGMSAECKKCVPCISVCARCAMRIRSPITAPFGTCSSRGCGSRSQVRRRKGYRLKDLCVSVCEKIGPPAAPAQASPNMVSQ
jgi:hypothetical protein